MQTLRLGSILVASDLFESSDAALTSAAALAQRTGAALHVLHVLDVPVSGYVATSTALDLQEQIHAARRALRAQSRRAFPTGVQPASLMVRVGSPCATILERTSEVAAELLVLGPHRPRAFRGPILGNTADRLLRSAQVPVLIAPEPVALPLARVVVPVDLSDPARGALDQGLRWAATLGANDVTNGLPAVEVRVMHVIPRIFESYDVPFDRAVIGPQLSHEIEAAVARTGGAAQVDVREEVVWGNSPADEIVDFAQSEHADLLVMGTHGYGAVGRALIGSITSRVARMAPCPMLLVPPPLWRTAPVQDALVPEEYRAAPAIPFA